MRSPEGNVYRLSGMFLEMEPPVRLVFTWIWDQGPTAGQGMLVTLESRERGE